jgi:hypothetical protein
VVKRSKSQSCDHPPGTNGPMGDKTAQRQIRGTS